MKIRHVGNVFLLGMILIGLQATRAPSPLGPIAIPASVATFVRGYADGDEATMLPVVSPLFRLELSRRGVTTPARRAELRPRGLTFTPRGGTRDTTGFGHWFYTTRSATPGGKAPLTVWRIDSDLRDLVIWIQPVYFFSGCDDVVDGPGRSPSRDRPDEALGTSPLIRFALHCATTAEGYYAIQSLDSRQLSYFTINADGDTLLGAWLFGENDLPEEGSTAAILGVNALFKGPGDQEYLVYYQSVRR